MHVMDCHKHKLLLTFGYRAALLGYSKCVWETHLRACLKSASVLNTYSRSSSELELGGLSEEKLHLSLAYKYKSSV